MQKDFKLLIWKRNKINPQYLDDKKEAFGNGIIK